MLTTTRLPDLPPPLSDDRCGGATTPAVGSAASSCGLLSDEALQASSQAAPAALIAFVKAERPVAAARALGLSERTVSRLAQGYWPADSRAVLAAWSAFAGRTAEPATSWMLRRVYDGGLVHHAQRAYTADLLTSRVGQLVAVARAAAGGLVAQTLELPLTRLTLAEVV